MIKTKATAIANSNTALVKYWGKQDEQLIIPMNNSISLTVDSLSTITTVDFSESYDEDLFILNKKIQNDTPKKRVMIHLDIIREIANVKLNAHIVSENNFPTAAGLASSASGFAALTASACKALGLNKTPKELSMLSRRGSGSSCRSFYGGYVEWIKNDDNDESYAIQLADENYFDIRDLVIVFEKHDRKYTTREAMKISKKTSPLYDARLKIVEDNLVKVRKAIKERDFTLLGQTAEADCLLMHSVALTSNPSLLFWTAETMGMIKFVQELREGGLEAYYTIDTGANMHILTKPEFSEEICAILRKIPYITNIIECKPGPGVQIIKDDLF